MLIRFLFDADAYPNADPGYQNDADPSESGSTTTQREIDDRARKYVNSHNVFSDAKINSRKKHHG
jgi:hypothetical protein